MGPTGCPQTTVTNYQSMLFNIAKKQRSHLYHGRNLKSCRWVPTFRKNQMYPPNTMKIKVSHTSKHWYLFTKRHGLTSCKVITPIN